MNGKPQLWLRPLDAFQSQPLPGTEGAQFPFWSPDGRYIGFFAQGKLKIIAASGGPAQREVYVRPFPLGEGQWRISLSGGEQPRWRGDDKELFFAGADGKLMAVPVAATPGAKPSFEAHSPQAPFEMHMAQSYNGSLPEYDVTNDGKRFLIDPVSGAVSASSLNVVVNWTASLK